MSVRSAIQRVEPSASERTAELPGDGIVLSPDVVIDRGFTLPAPVDSVWPWFVQLGKARAGWYLPRSLERLIPPRRRGVRSIDPRLQELSVGDVIPDWGGRDESFEVAIVVPPSTLVHRSRRARTDVSWAIVLAALDGSHTRVHLRLRLGPVKRRWLAETAGETVDLLTIAGLAAGLRERV